jgi:hypothetical protein
MRGFPDVYTNYTTIRQQCLNPHHPGAARKRYACDFVYVQAQLAPILNRWHIP